MASFSKNYQIDFITPEGSPEISLSVFDSDSINNLVVMEQVVGTLVKYNGVGRYEPYLAKKWNVSSDQKIWTFVFNDNLISEDGVVINAQSFSQSLKHLLKIYSKQYTPPSFKHLKGWDQFVRGEDDSLGVTAIGNTLELSFSKRPSGLLEFLSMPYFGFYGPSNFDGNLWKDKKIVFSSGSYKVAQYSNTDIILELRKNWPLSNSKAPPTVKISRAPKNKFLDLNKNLIIQSINLDFENLEGLIRFNSTPTILTGVTLSPYVYPFNIKENREAFRNVLRAKASEIPNSVFSRGTQHFYKDFSKFPLNTGSYAESIKLLRSLKIEELAIFKQKLTSDDDSNFINSALEKVIKEIGWKVKVSTSEEVGSGWIHKVSDNKTYALRTTRVDIGGSAENWVIDMMFCSRLGISFPDENQNVCSIVQQYDNNEIIDEIDYKKRLHRAIEENSSIIPLLHSGFSWLISSSIDTKNISSSMNIPRFDQMRINE